MKRFTLAVCFFLFLFLFAACERPDYKYEIWEMYINAKRDSTSGAVIDGNMWSAISMEHLDWEEAVAYCRNLKELEHSDWRLPTVNELRTLIQNCPGAEAGGFCNMTEECLEEEMSYIKCYDDYCSCGYNEEEGYYSKLGDDFCLWSSTATRISDYAVNVCFGQVDILTQSKSYNRYVRCIR